MTSRPVWLTREQRTWLEDFSYYRWVRDITAAWDAAPADPAEAIAKATYFSTWGEEPDDASDLALDLFKAADVLRALGCPDPEPHA